MRKYLTLLATLLCCVVTFIPSKGQDVFFSHLSTENGLSNVSVIGIYVDERGIVWIGTRNGLNKFDSRKVTSYTQRRDDPDGLFSNSILSITGDGKGKLFLRCTEGVSFFDLETGRFKTIHTGNVSSIAYHDGLYVCFGNEIFRYDIENDSFSSFASLQSLDADVLCMHFTDRHLWAGTTGNGVFRMDLATKQIEHIIPEGNITCIYEDSVSDLWIGSWTDGIHHIESDGNVIQLRESDGLSSDFVRACCEDNLGNLWFGTFHGLDKYDRATGKVLNYKSDPANRNGLAHSSIWALAKDAQGTIWIGTYFAGVHYFNPEYETYNLLTAKTHEKDGLSSPIISDIIEGSDGDMWIGTEGGGINRFNRRTGELRWYLDGVGPRRLSHGNIKSLCHDFDKDILWVGTHTGGLNRLDVKTGMIKVYRQVPGNPRTLPSDIVRDIVIRKDKLVLGTQNGVCLFDPAEGSCEQLFKDTPEGRMIKIVNNLFLDRDDRLWISTTGEGAFSYDFRTGKLVNWRHRSDYPGSLSGNNVNNVVQDRSGNLWFAMSGTGLDMLREGSNSFENFGVENSDIPSNCIYSVQVLEDSSEIFLVSNEGFSFFDSRASSFRNFHAKESTPYFNINENSVCVTRSGEVFLGGLEGVLSFEVDKLVRLQKPYRILLDKLYVNGTEVVPSDGGRILDKELGCTSAIRLRPNETSFSIDFTTTNHIPGNKSDIVYKLEGFSSAWENSLDKYNVTYTNLPPGRYRLIVKSRDDDASICPPAMLGIVIGTPFYKSTVAILAYLLLAGLLISAFVITNRNKLRMKERLKYEQLRNQDIEMINHAKLQFFTNVSHEFRTPLTMIVAQAEALIRTPQANLIHYDKLLNIYKNSIQLDDLLTELLEFRKQEQGHLKIRVSPHDIVPFLHENYLLFEEYVLRREIKLVFQKDVDELVVWYDKNKMQKVVNNLLSNASKYTPSGGTITMGVSREKEEAVIWVSDNGIGIAPDERQKIFNRFYCVDSSKDSKAGIGIGLALTRGIVKQHSGSIDVESKVGEGTRFTIRLPLGSSHFSEEEKVPAQDDNSFRVMQVPGESDMKRDILPDAPAVKNSPPTKMLVVEDNDSIRELLCEVFRPYYHVLCAVDGKGGWDCVQAELPDIVLSDILMPGLTGIELCRLIKQDFKYCHIPVVLLTARVGVEQKIEGFDIGADDYITKPFNISLLISRCNNLLNARKQLWEKFYRQPLSRPRMMATNPIDREILEKAEKVIQDHLDDTELNVSTFAQEMAMSRTVLFSKLKAVTGQTPNDFILSVRLNTGAKMLRDNPELNVTEISEKIGFNTARYFGKCFRDRFGVSPSAWRKNNSTVAEEA